MNHNGAFTVRKISISKSAGAVDSIQMTYGSEYAGFNTGPRMGGKGGTWETYDIGLGERIQAIHMVKGIVCDSEIIVGIQFVLKNARKLGSTDIVPGFGVSNISRRTVRPDRPSGCHLWFIHGGAGDALDRIGFKWFCQ